MSEASLVDQIAFVKCGLIVGSRAELRPRRGIWF